MNDSARPQLAAGMRLPLAGRILDLGRGELLDADGRRIELRPQVFEVLRVLALNAGRIVGRDELMAAVWPGLVVTDDSLVQAISDLRRGLGDDAHRLVKTLPRRGYLLVADAVAPPPPTDATRDEPPAATEARREGGGAAAAQAAPPKSADASRRRLGIAALGLALALGTAAAWRARPWRDADRRDDAQRPPPMPDRPSIAVLAFRDPGGDALAQQLARGVAEEVIAQLARNVDLRVVSAQSSLGLSRASQTAADIGRRLRSRYFVDGTVRREGELLHIGVELVDSEDGHVVWTARHTVDSARLPATRDALAARIAGSVHSRMRQSEERRALSRPPKTMDVYAMTLRAVALKHQFRPDATREARRLLEQAIAIDPEYAPAWLYLGMVNTLDSLLRLTGEWHPGRYDEMLAQARRAIELDAQLPAAYFGLALAHIEGRRFDEALAAAQRAADLGPNDADCVYYLATVQARMGLIEPARRNMAHALDLSPIPPSYVNAGHAVVAWVGDDLDEAVRAADDCLDKAPRHLVCRRVRMLALAELGRLEAAAEEARTIGLQVRKLDVDWVQSAFDPRADALHARVRRAALAAGLAPGAQAEAAAALAGGR